jgi:methionyl-tRNA synthetase
LANGLGNLVARVAKLADKSDFEFENQTWGDEEFNGNLSKLLVEFRFDEALKNIWTDIKILDQMLDEKKPWAITNHDELKNTLQVLVDGVRLVARDLQPFLPETANNIFDQFKGHKIGFRPPMFPRIQNG